MTRIPSPENRKVGDSTPPLATSPDQRKQSPVMIYDDLCLI